MSGERTRPWVGDLVHDADTGRQGIVTDVRRGVYVLRPERGPGAWAWTSERPERLGVVVAREEMGERL
ncbi:hypothetical protein [Streptomyces lichenis]|uniref:Uncharacterized protein n=1 Tax=Streptomyces lichenis TaxID=2306967 RepID=A0ABT0IIZ7_9ACTN|nr:hypothetical protein [Streptomyces lichenis]MCK8681297.1 hypothetical protein [Streptomyces lichenis]